MRRGVGTDTGSLGGLLGWFSTGLGLAQVAAPGAMSRLVGVSDTGEHRVLMRALGVRELTAGAGIFSSDKPTGWLWSRVVGDVMDLAILGAALHAEGNRRGRVAVAGASVLGVTVVDVIASVRAGRPTRTHGELTEEEAMHARATTTINLEVDRAYRYWRDLENLPVFMDHLQSVKTTDGRRSHWIAHGPAGTTVEWDAEIVEDVPGELISWRSLEGADVTNTGSVHFVPAPKGRGTEVTVEMDYETPGGKIGSAVAKLLGEEPSQQVKDDLRRFKQVLETGEVVRSDGTPGGIRALGQARQRRAQPVG